MFCELQKVKACEGIEIIQEVLQLNRMFLVNFGLRSLLKDASKPISATTNAKLQLWNVQEIRKNSRNDKFLI